MAVTIQSGQVLGLEGFPIDIEVDLSQGLHRFSVVGLPDKAVEESRERISSAIKNTGLRPPHKKNQRVTVNLAPADVKKEGPLFDLPIALAYALASGQTTFSPKGKMFIGELALDGTVRKARGVLSLARVAKQTGVRDFFVPKGNGKEAAFVSGLRIFEVSSLQDILEHLEERVCIPTTPPTAFQSNNHTTTYGFEDIKGQEHAKRAAEIAASGMHHMAMVGPPGSGKTLIARALPSILPPLSFEQALEVTAIHSVAGIGGDALLHEGLLNKRPFRSPHHTASYAALVGGGHVPKPGEVTLAHRGVLFLDEFPEFERRVAEALREPLEEGYISISRVKHSLTFPARMLLVAAMNLCPCGNRGTKKDCMCSMGHLARYARRLSGPIVDRIDLWTHVGPVAYEKLESDERAEPSAVIQQRTTRAWNIQQKRFCNALISTNSEIGARDMQTFCPLSRECKTTLQQAAEHLKLSARSYHRVIKVARTIADLDNSNEIKESHILEALQYRPRDYGIV